MKAVETGPKFLPFERTYALEWEKCARCAGSGRTRHAVPRYADVCYNCRGLGRKITARGRELWREICRALGKPVAEKESRIEPKWLGTIHAQYVRPGMCVGAIYPVKRPPKVVSIVESLGVQLRFTFEGSSQAVFSTHDSLSRELTPAELSRVGALMAEQLNQGAVLAATAPAPT